MCLTNVRTEEAAPLHRLLYEVPQWAGCVDQAMAVAQGGKRTFGNAALRLLNNKEAATCAARIEG
jgi:hypothetical protein